MRLIRWLTLVLILFAAGACAEAIPNAQVGLVLIHGKWGSPPGPDAQLFSSNGFEVESPWMPWSKSGYYAKPYDQALAEVHDIVQKMRSSGIKRVIVGGLSFGANAALAYATQYDDADGIILFSPGHMPERFYQSGGSRESVAAARELVAEGKGDSRFNFMDPNQGKTEGRSTTASNYLSYFEPEGLGNMPLNATRLKKPIPVLCVMSQAEWKLGRDYIFSKLPPNPKSVYLEPRASHTDSPRAVESEALAFVRSVASD